LASGAASYLFPTNPIYGGNAENQTLAALTSTAIGQGLNAAFPTTSKGSSSSSVSPVTPSALSSVTGQSTVSPGTAALGQALRTDPSAIFGTDTSSPQRNVWNTASLRVKDETGA